MIWNVLETVQEATPDQIFRMNQLFRANFTFARGRGNNRDVQPLAGRSVVLHNHKPVGDGDGLPIPLAAEEAAAPESGAAASASGAAPEDAPAQNASAPVRRRRTLPALYAKGGADWPALCRSGRAQSPIDIKLAVGNPHGWARTRGVVCTRAYLLSCTGKWTSRPCAAVQALTPRFRLSRSDWEMLANYVPAKPRRGVEHVGWTLLSRGNFGNLYVQGEAEPYVARRILFHSPSEHLLDGRRAALELEVVHVQGSGAQARRAVVSVLFSESSTEHSDFLDSLSWRLLPFKKGQHVELPEGVNLSLLRGLNEGHYSYAGSLSQPPCTEGVKRFVLRTVNAASTFQVGRFRRIFFGNNR